MMMMESGMSATMIHELGHSLGYPHPHSEFLGWGSSFIKETMNYFSRGEAGFSSFYEDALARSHGNYWYSYTSSEFYDAYEDFADEGTPDHLVACIVDIGLLLDAAAANYTKMDYLGCIAHSKAALDKIDLFYLLLNDPDATNTEVEETILSSITLIAITVLSTSIFLKRRRK